MVFCKAVCAALYFLDQILPSNNEVEAFQSETVDGTTPLAHPQNSPSQIDTGPVCL